MSENTMKQKSIIVSGRIVDNGTLHEAATKDLNKHLEEGWRVKDISPMGGTGAGETSRAFFASIVILESE